MKNVIEVRGKARQVFKYLDLLNRHKGNVTIAKLAQENKPFKLDLRK
jgi:hypothetical protein